MLDIYSPALVVALVSIAICFGAGFLARRARLSPPRDTTTPRLRLGLRLGLRLARWSRAAAALALLAAIVSHVSFGHRPGTELGLGPFGFVAAHPIVVVIAALLALSFLPLRSRNSHGVDLSRRPDRGRD